MWILGSHNSWSYLPVRKWWMKPLTFAAKCQDLNIKDQYNIYNVRCFDLRIRFDENDGLIVAHGIIEYDINIIELLLYHYFLVLKVQYNLVHKNYLLLIRMIR